MMAVSPLDLVLRPERVGEKLASTDRPYLTLKAAVSLDGKSATRGGQSQWITGPTAREFGHRLREQHAGIVVGINTVLADDPQLTVRLAESPARPARIVLDSLCRIPLGARFLAADGARRLVICGAEAPAARVEALRKAGVEVIIGSGARPHVTEYLPFLRESGLTTLLVEGGGRIHANLIANREPDELFLMVAGRVIGGSEAPAWCDTLGVDTIEQAPRLSLSPPLVLGEDIVIHGTFHFGSRSSGEEADANPGERRP